MDKTYLIVIAVSILPTLALTKYIADENEFLARVDGRLRYVPNYIMGISWALYLPFVLLAGTSFFKSDDLLLTFIIIPVVIHITLFSISFIFGKKTV